MMWIPRAMMWILRAMIWILRAMLWILGAYSRYHSGETRRPPMPLLGRGTKFSGDDSRRSRVGGGSI
eukprot:5311943-Pyramimonas_sp.AAC.1